MNLVSLDIYVGSMGRRVIEGSKEEFHRKVACMLFPGETDIDRLGSDQVSGVTHRDYVHNPGVISDILCEAIHSQVKLQKQVDLCILDFTSNPFVCIRDPLLIALIEGINLSCTNAWCKCFAVLLPGLPGSNSASVARLEAIEQETEKPDHTIILLTSSGKNLVFSSQDYELPEIRKQYTDSILELYGNPTRRLERKLVRRLGHFQTSYAQAGTARCRNYSYVLHDCESELFTLFSGWWTEFGQAGKAILFDLGNNLPLRDSVKAFAEKHSMRAERIPAVLGNPSLAKQIADIGPGVLVLDAVDTGATLKQHVANLVAHGVTISDHVLVAVNKTGARTSQHDGYHVHGFLAVDSESEPSPCIQCKLGLPITQASHEPITKIRAFDMLHMAHVSGWGPEPEWEVPGENAKQYEMIPDFSKILDNFGDWISYKIHRLLESVHSPVDYFIIHPDEQDSSALSAKMQVPLDQKLHVVTVPRKLITEAQKQGNSWGEVLREDPAAPFIAELTSICKFDAPGLILDIFSGSGSTWASLKALLSHFGISTFGCLCFVDFDPDQVHTDAGGTREFSLYDWYNPRQYVNEEEVHAT